MTQQIRKWGIGLFETPPRNHQTLPEKGTLASFTQVILAAFDEVRGHQPLASYPDTDLILNENAMKPIAIHSAWFLSVEEQEEFDHIDLEYNGRTYLAKKFRVPNFGMRKKERAGSEDETFETMVFFVSVPDELNIIGSNVLEKLYNSTQQSLGNELYKLVQGDISRAKPIKTAQTRQIIQEAEDVKARFYKLCEWNLAQVSTRILRQISDSVTKQKALAYLMLVNGEKNPAENSAAGELFEHAEEGGEMVGPPIEISNIGFCVEKECIEVILVNNREEDIDAAKILVSNVEGVFEKHFFE